MTDKTSENSFQHLLWIISLITCILQVCVVNKAYGQQYSWEEFVEKISVDEYDEYDYLTPLLEDLTELHEHPFNLNTATKEELEQLPFLTDEDVEEILAYVYRHGPLQSLGELKLIARLDYQTAQFLGLFVYVAPPGEKSKRIKWKDLWKYGHQELMTRLDIPLYKREGFIMPEEDVLRENPNKVYLGNGLYHNIRYAYRYKGKLFWGLTMEKDAGEPFGSYGNKAYDAYSFHFLLKDCGILRTLALGDYRLNFGEGLVVNTDFSFGKPGFWNMNRKTTPVKKFSSTSETSFFRGMAGTVGVGPLEVSVFYSYLPVDATLKKDGNISSLKTDGLHRTLSEVSKKHNVTEQSAGGDITWNARHFSAGMLMFYQHFSKSFSKGEQKYRQYYPEGKNFMNASLHYRLHYDKFLFAGETAFSNTYQGWATLNKLSYRFSHRYSIMALYRLFAYQYVGLRGNSFSEGGMVKNESGVYVGLEASPLNELKLYAYFDYFYFPWVKFATPHTSDGYEMTVQADWVPDKRWNASGRYQLKRKERYGHPYLYHKLKAQVQCMFADSWNVRMFGRYTQVSDLGGTHVSGYMAGGIVRWTEKKNRVSLSLSGVCFDSEDYKAPMSFYEPSLLYAFSFMTLYGRGIRAALTGRWNISGRWMLMLKYGMTDYWDRDVIGEGLQRINSSCKNDLSFLLRYKF